MALPRPTITNITRDGSAGVVTVSSTSGNEVYAFIINLVAGGNNLIDGPSRVGDGDITLDLTALTFTLFGYTVEAPYAVFVMTTDGVGNYSLPSRTVRPWLLTSTPFTISNLKRSPADSGKIEFVVGGLPPPSDEYKLVAIWNDRDNNIFAEGMSADNGKKTLTSDFDLDWAYSVVFMGTDPNGSWFLPLTVQEKWSRIGDTPPTLDRVILDDENRQLQAYFTPPVSQYVATNYIMYRDLSIGEKTWRMATAAQSPTVLTGLDRGHVYQLQAVSKDAQGKFSTPSATIDMRVMG